MHPKSPKCAPFWAQKWGFSEKCRKSPKTLRNAIKFEIVICCILSQSMSRHLLFYVMSCCIFGQSTDEHLINSSESDMQRIRLDDCNILIRKGINFKIFLGKMIFVSRWICPLC